MAIGEAGSLVMTADNGPQRIRWIGRRHLTKQDLEAQPGLRPVRITAHALGKQLPERDLLLSRQHRMFISYRIAQRMFGKSEVLVAARKGLCRVTTKTAATS